MKKRSESLDALRGTAILLMVLSGSIAFGNVLPGWMYHAQVPPPAHVFHPEIPGITWVDLVFPFFLFSMGAAFPLSFTKKLEQKEAWYLIAGSVLQRGLLLAFFSIFTMHIRIYVNEQASAQGWLLAIAAFVLIHCMFVQWPASMPKKIALTLKVVSFITSIFILSQLHYKNGAGFIFTRIDIIIMVLANMAVFGSAAWLLTRNNPWYRVLILPFVMGIFLSGAVADSWTAKLFNWTPAPDIYTFYYLKYLFIIIPGTIAGELLMIQLKKQETPHTVMNVESWLLAFISFLLVIANLISLYGRYLQTGLFVSMALCGVAILLAKRIASKTGNNLYTKLVTAGSYLLLLGLVFEAYQGGIKKDISTYSYYFVSSGLAFFVLAAFISLEEAGKCKAVIGYLSGNGKNPMVAYVAGNLILIPLLHLTATMPLLDALHGNAWQGFLRGIIFTGIVSVVTLLFVRWKWFWKT